MSEAAGFAIHKGVTQRVLSSLEMEMSTGSGILAGLRCQLHLWLATRLCRLDESARFSKSKRAGEAVVMLLAPAQRISNGAPGTSKTFFGGAVHVPLHHGVTKRFMALVSQHFAEVHHVI